MLYLRWWFYGLYETIVSGLAVATYRTQPAPWNIVWPIAICVAAVAGEMLWETYRPRLWPGPPAPTVWAPLWYKPAPWWRKRLRGWKLWAAFAVAQASVLAWIWYLDGSGR